MRSRIIRNTVAKKSLIYIHTYIGFAFTWSLSSTSSWSRKLHEEILNDGACFNVPGLIIRCKLRQIYFRRRPAVFLGPRQCRRYKGSRWKLPETIRTLSIGFIVLHHATLALARPGQMVDCVVEHIFSTKLFAALVSLCPPLQPVSSRFPCVSD